jgi:hypothetical protein
MLFKVTRKVLVTGPIAAKYNLRTGKLISKEAEFVLPSIETVSTDLTFAQAKEIRGHDHSMNIVPLSRS